MRPTARVPLSVRLARSAAKLRSDGLLVVLDQVVSAGAYTGVLVLRFDGAVSGGYWGRLAMFLPAAVLVGVASNWIWGLYGQMWRHASVVEARRVLAAGATTLILLTAGFVVGNHLMPASVVVLGTACATMFVGLLRFQSRLFAFRRRAVGDVTRVLVVGAGRTGGSIMREMLRDDHARFRPVGVVDDDPRKQGLSVLGVPVLGTVDAVAEAITISGADVVLLAIPSADGALVRKVARLADGVGCTVKTLPTIAELVGSSATMRDVRDVSIDDLLGRQQVEVDIATVRASVSGRRVLITGAGGSIGSEIARQLAALDPEAVILLDHDETHLHEAAHSIRHETVQALVDIRDARALEAIFACHAPDVVFHAAAHKHVPILEDYPAEAIRTNAFGTMNLVECCNAHGVERLVFISTDKAVRPRSVMGASKRLGEQIVLANRPDGVRYCAVRFGNVLGSRGSVIPTFMRQIASGGPVTVTDTRMTRFFMSIPEAMQLVLQAAALAEGGEVFMLDMGEPVRIVDLAERIIRLSGRRLGTDIDVSIVGIRPGEKLHEELRDPDDQAFPTAHPSIVALYPPHLPTDELARCLERLDGCVRRRDDVMIRDELLRVASRRGTEIRVTDAPNVQKVSDGVH